ncbi:MAG TPA: META domain-containing protein [Phenylobacterium sp.]
MPGARTVATLVAAGWLAGCASPEKAGPAPALSQPRLTGTEWRLVAFQSSDDSIGKISPAPGETYTLHLDPKGGVAMGLSCNRGVGSWKSPDAGEQRGSLLIGPIASTRAMCPPSRLQRIAADMEHVRSFVIQDGRLHLNLWLDSGDYIWEPAP